jgi:hypothetical protein
VTGQQLVSLSPIRAFAHSPIRPFAHSPMPFPASNARECTRLDRRIALLHAPDLA